MTYIKMLSCALAVGAVIAIGHVFEQQMRSSSSQAAPSEAPSPFSLITDIKKNIIPLTILASAPLKKHEDALAKQHSDVISEKDKAKEAPQRFVVIEHKVYPYNEKNEYMVNGVPTIYIEPHPQSPAKSDGQVAAAAHPEQVTLSESHRQLKQLLNDN